ncbi:hypothetical protein C8Q80DRAFT_137534 [Daedaleopsis nitida]|nr:hypothetical protein C8Q80DRAFT_137534 [Daedaleopsis nitida]
MDACSLILPLLRGLRLTPPQYTNPVQVQMSSPFSASALMPPQCGMTLQLTRVNFSQCRPCNMPPTLSTQPVSFPD